MRLLYSASDTFNPYTAETDQNRRLCTLLFDSLTRLNNDFEAVNLLAESVEIKDKKVMIVGNGGAAKTAKAVISDMGAKEIFVLSRQENTPETLVKHGDTEVLINTSPVGMYPKNGEAPIELENFKSCTGVADLIYNPKRTKLWFGHS